MPGCGGGDTARCPQWVYNGIGTHAEARIPERNQDNPLHRWLASRLAGQLGDRSEPEAGPQKPKQTSPPRSEPASRPPQGGGRAQPNAPAGPLPLSVGLGHFGAAPEADDDPETVVDQNRRNLLGGRGGVVRLGPVFDEDPETVVGDRALAEDLDDPHTAPSPGATPPNRSAEHDPETVQLSRLPLSFIGESIMDPDTQFDPRPEAARWREETQSRIDELPPGPLPSAIPDRSSPTLAREERHPPVPPEEESEGRSMVLVWILAGAVSGFVLIALILAFIAGSLAM